MLLKRAYHQSLFRKYLLQNSSSHHNFLLRLNLFFNIKFQLGISCIQILIVDELLAVNNLAFLYQQHFIVFISVLQYSLEWVPGQSSWYSDYVMGLTIRGLGPRRGKRFFTSTKMPKLALGPTQSPIQQVLGLRLRMIWGSEVIATIISLPHMP